MIPSLCAGSWRPDVVSGECWRGHGWAWGGGKDSLTAFYFQSLVLAPVWCLQVQSRGSGLFGFSTVFSPFSQIAHTYTHNSVALSSLCCSAYLPSLSSPRHSLQHRMLIRTNCSHTDRITTHLSQFRSVFTNLCSTTPSLPQSLLSNVMSLVTWC